MVAFNHHWALRPQCRGITILCTVISNSKSPVSIVNIYTIKMTMNLFRLGFLHIFTCFFMKPQLSIIKWSLTVKFTGQREHEIMWQYKELVTNTIDKKKKNPEDKCPVSVFYTLLTNGRKQKKAKEIKHSLSRILKQLRNENLGLTTKEMFRNLTLGPYPLSEKYMSSVCNLNKNLAWENHSVGKSLRTPTQI